MSTIPEPSKNIWGAVLQRNRLEHPAEFVVRFLSHVRKYQQPGAEALDVGFGGGQNLAALIDEGYVTHGTEFLPEAIEAVKLRFADSPLLGRVLLTDIEEDLFEAASLDVVMCYGVLFLKPISQQIKDLALITKWLKPGGRLLVNFRTPSNWFCGLGKELEPGFFEVDERAGSYFGSTYAFLNEQQAREVVTAAGLNIENFERWDWWKNNMQEQHSWWIAWAVKP